MTSQNEGPNETVIELKNLTKIFGPRPQKMLTHLQNGCTTKEIREKTGHVVALRNISFSVKKGEIFVLMGL